MHCLETMKYLNSPEGLKFREKKQSLIYCNLCGEGSPVKDIGLVYGQITCVGCAEGMGEELRDRGMAQ